MVENKVGAACLQIDGSLAPSLPLKGLIIGIY
jgi:hypothetical protein